MHQLRGSSYKAIKQAHDSYGSVDLRNFLNSTTFYVIGDLAFGGGFGCLKSSSYHVWVRMVLNFFNTTIILHVCHKSYPLDRDLTLIIPTSVTNKKDCHTKMSLEKVRQRMGTGSDRLDYISYLVKGSKSETLTIPEIKTQASLLFWRAARRHRWDFRQPLTISFKSRML